ncbi:carboxypeptidase S [Lentinus tigrinus ALCF2SS1-7]|uniref:Carboxypeptidase S n=1 Tax=Lentinus tigrinus ALCF2SS1-6 TaxID=1328759 RepID=A0A5C2SJM9_9APHY|nr:carboxypeptidase S [Lentinus tigrinus ALCF2SS1-6]RPD76225.1 carboxypeptidase S [Lentinus tigrinus ALCF2SS1-7]
MEFGNASVRPGGARIYFSLATLTALGLSLFYFFARSPHFGPCGASTTLTLGALDEVCPQTTAIAPEKNRAFLDTLEEQYQSEGFKLQAYESLGGAIRVPTVAYDDLAPPGQDERWEIFGQLHAYLAERFPLVHATLRKTHVNKYALVYHWQGSDESLKPALLTAHQDVVPVEPLTVDQWIHPPFSGHYDGEYIWGRGSCDDKPGLIGTLTAVEELLRAGFTPTRTFVLAYGIDEERGGISGATAIRDYLIATYGEYAFSILVDEGGGYGVSDDVIMVNPGVAEKGKFDVRFEISAPGGHSSIPPEHTSIGLLAAVIKQLENNPHTPHLNRSGIYYNLLQCRAEHDPSLSEDFRSLITGSRKSDKALHALEQHLARTDRLYSALAGTTQAADVVHGGVKANALPEQAEVIVNHRVDIHSSIAALQARIASVVKPIVKQYRLELDAFGLYKETIEDGGDINGLLRITDAWGTALEPAPITPMGDSGPFKLLSGTIIGVLGASNRTGYDKKVFIAPSMSTGNTDTKHYWKLTKHIYRYGHMNGEDSYNGAHTINEAVRGEGFLEIIRFFTWVILNVDESALLD